MLLTDTVGFVRKLPHQLVEAFRSTLEVVREADLLLHVVDGSAPDPEGQIDAVRTVLAEIGADGRPRAAGGQQGRRLGTRGAEAGEEARRLMAAHPGAVVVSARTGPGHRRAVVALGDRLRVGDRVVELVVPFARGDVLAAVHREGEMWSTRPGEEAHPDPRRPRRGRPGPLRGVPGVVSRDVAGRRSSRRPDSCRRPIPTTG